ncbi:MAG: class I SAM-dependent methyltransferase [Peptococcaceae bacterium]|jgi:tRNA (adenine22-N1)-methyltransferase|nr:class I SAM-dependent methyltransferase [Peptococcaceae bacterium]
MAEPTPRLKQVASLVPRGTVVADIGTDHALLPMYLVREGVCPRVIATEVADGPLRLAGANLASFPWRERVELRRGDGLSVLAPGEADAVVLAGMGGNTMRAMLTAAPAVLAAGPLLILQPMNGERRLRQWLYEHDRYIVAERLVRERGRLYVVMAAVPGRAPLPDLLALTVGPRLIENRDPLLPVHLERLAGRLEVLRRSLAGARGPVPRAGEVDTLLGEIREVRRCLFGEKT